MNWITVANVNVVLLSSDRVGELVLLNVLFLRATAMSME